MIKTGKVKATQIGTGSQPKAYTIKRSDLEAQAKTQEEPTPILSLNLVQRLGGSQYGVPHNSNNEPRSGRSEVTLSSVSAITYESGRYKIRIQNRVFLKLREMRVFPCFRRFQDACNTRNSV